MNPILHPAGLEIVSVLFGKAVHQEVILLGMRGQRAGGQGDRVGVEGLVQRVGGLRLDLHRAWCNRQLRIPNAACHIDVGAHNLKEKPSEEGAQCEAGPHETHFSIDLVHPPQEPNHQDGRHHSHAEKKGGEMPGQQGPEKDQEEGEEEVVHGRSHWQGKGHAVRRRIQES